eukprot:8101025-Heterocapsa_arctica.AAC.1
MMPASECVVRSGSFAKCVRMSLRLPRSARMTREKGEGERAKLAAASRDSPLGLSAGSLGRSVPGGAAAVGAEGSSVGGP